MKPLYSRADLQNKHYLSSKDIMRRYLFKFHNHRNEIGKLKFHEKDFFFEHLRILKDKNNEYCFDLLDIPEAYDYLFCLIILIFSQNGRISFDGKIRDFDGVIPCKRKASYKRFFGMYMKKWESSLMSGADRYLSITKDEFLRKTKDIERLFEDGIISFAEKCQKHFYAKTVFFYIYYKTKIFFDELPQKYCYRIINGHWVVADVYTYCHVLSRHYFPSMNKKLDVSLNDDIPGVDISNLPISMLDIVESCSSYVPLEKCTEFYLMIINDVKYIVWLKYGMINSAQHEGFQIRTFYNCVKDTDLILFENKKLHRIHPNIYVCA